VAIAQLDAMSRGRAGTHPRRLPRAAQARLPDLDRDQAERIAAEAHQAPQLVCERPGRPGMPTNHPGMRTEAGSHSEPDG